MKNIRLTLKFLIISFLVFGCAAKKDQPKPSLNDQKAKATLSLHEAILMQDVL